MTEPPILAPAAHESLRAPRTLLGVVILALFAATVLLPYFYVVPVGAASNLILTTGETVKNIVILVVGYYFGTTQGSSQKSDALAQSVAATADLAKTAKTAGEALAATTGTTPGEVNLQPGDSVKVAAADDAPDDPTMYGGPRL